jgi:hypothetical protein
VDESLSKLAADFEVAEWVLCWLLLTWLVMEVKRLRVEGKRGTREGGRPFVVCVQARPGHQHAPGQAARPHAGACLDWRWWRNCQVGPERTTISPETRTLELGGAWWVDDHINLELDSILLFGLTLYTS